MATIDDLTIVVDPSLLRGTVRIADLEPLDMLRDSLQETLNMGVDGVEPIAQHILENPSAKSDLVDYSMSYMPDANGMSATLTGDTLEQISDVQAVLAPQPINPAALEVSATWAATGADLQDILNRFAEIAIRNIWLSSDNTVFQSFPEGQRFRRYASANACGFCQLMALRGAVYYSRESAGERSQYHNNCRCLVIPDSVGVPDYYNKWKDRYERSKEALGPKPSNTDVINFMRRDTRAE
ncbi:head maturation protease [Gordonia phage Ronaldo]|uniref:MuF-like minor capsid protein n=4 Tax=Ronaldovirus TaxID=2733205 RepID=A0A6B9LJP4_9CAUD|nr:head maturation protease [Gordonia phage Fryberger]YP_009807735.1 head maturation protease [Gordonia phage Ronaldo]QDH48378.1 MuF-like minor capsid protein [Gordonia phage Ziko]QHB38154.1 MuF-like minor capsid protein [Gordonia phage Volt]AXN53454.1 MuF-like minor capsid protein [Gordonia phage Fryberger]AXN53601.1 MuF-like minor capsid protein [Gordonia phage Ronaldo]